MLSNSQLKLQIQVKLLVEMQSKFIGELHIQQVALKKLTVYYVHSIRQIFSNQVKNKSFTSNSTYKMSLTMTSQMLTTMDSKVTNSMVVTIKLQLTRTLTKNLIMLMSKFKAKASNMKTTDSQVIKLKTTSQTMVSTAQCQVKTISNSHK